MSANKSAAEPADAAKVDFNSKTIQNMTSREIYAANRERNKGTLMDKSWRKASQESLSAYYDPELTFAQKLFKGAFTYQSIATNKKVEWSDRYEKVQFLEALLANRADYPEIEDQLVLKKLENQVLVTQFNVKVMWRLPFFVGGLALLSNAKVNLPVRLLVPLVVMPGVLMGENLMMLWAMHRRVDSYLDETLLKARECRVAKQAAEFLELRAREKTSMREAYLKAD